MSESHAARGTRRGRRALATLGEEVRTARLVAGLTLGAAASAAGVSASELSRVERGLAPWLTIVAAARICSVVGLDLSVRTYPGGDPVRDAAHVRLLDAFTARLAPGLTVRIEVPIGERRDQRAWDVTISNAAGDVVAVELESRLRDGQALARRINLKRRDGGVDRVIVVLNDTTANRRAVAATRAALRSVFPLDPPDIFGPLASGHLPTDGGIVFDRPTRTDNLPRDGSRMNGRARHRPRHRGTARIATQRPSDRGP